VGRWSDGTPVQLSPDAPNPAIATDPMRVNHFALTGAPAMRVDDGRAPVSLRREAMASGAHGGARTIDSTPADPTAQQCPFFAHIRKVHPRGVHTDQGEPLRTVTFQMLRRGIPYGPPFASGAENADRGLLFLAYQTSFHDQFRVLNSVWMNNPEVPEKGGEGFDMLIGQNPDGDERYGVLFDDTGNSRGRVTTMMRFVVATGGAFLFAPSLSFLRALSNGVAAA
jgi:hypothetical protein